MIVHLRSPAKVSLPYEILVLDDGRARKCPLRFVWAANFRIADHSPRIALMRYTVGQRVAWPLLRARHPGM